MFPPGISFIIRSFALKEFLSDSTEKNTSKKYVSYEELRQRNRAEYASKFPASKARTGLSFSQASLLSILPFD